MNTRVLLLLLVWLAGCGGRKQALHLLIWPEYIDPTIISDFESRFDCRVTVDYFDDGNLMIAKLSSGGDRSYDLVPTSNESLPGMVARGLLAPLRHERIPNLRNLDDQFLHASFDPGNRYGVPCLWGTTGLFARKSKGAPINETWGLLFDPAQQPGPFVLLDDPRFGVAGALWYKGHSINSIDPAQLAEVRPMIVEALGRSLGFSTSVGGRNRVLSKELAVAVVSSSDGIRGVKEDSDTHYFIPREGGALWVDTLSIPAKAPNRDLAEAFINFLLEPEIGARWSNYSNLATANKAAKGFISHEDRNNPALYPPPDVMRRLEFCNDLGDKQKLYDELWTQIKAK